MTPVLGVVASGRYSVDYANIVKSDNPVAYWRLGEPGATAIDQMGAASLSYRAGSSAVAGLISGDGARSSTTGVAIGPNGPSVAAIAGQLTVEAWVKPAGTTSPWGVLVQDDSGGLGHFYFMFLGASSGWRIGWYDTAYRDNDFSATVTLGVLYHVVATVGASTITMTVNGTVIGTKAKVGAPVAQVNTANSLGIGIRPNANFPLNGTMDEVAIYAYALPLSRIQAHYAAGVAA